MLPSLSSREKADWEEEPDQNLRDLGPEQKHHRHQGPRGRGEGRLKKYSKKYG